MINLTLLLCTRCGRVYEEDEEPLYEYDHAENGRIYRTGTATCHCGGELTAAVRCSECGEIIPYSEREISENGEALCSVCYEEQQKDLYEPRKSA